MTTLDRVFVYLGVLVAVVLAAVGVHETRSMQPAQFRFVAAAPITIALDYDHTCSGTTCTCSQTAINSTMEGQLVVVHSGNYIAWINRSSAPVEGIFLQQTSPFYGFTNASGSVSSGQVTGNSGDTFFYDSLSVSGKACSNAHTLGLIMR
jgi:hypothetical protein